MKFFNLNFLIVALLVVGLAGCGDDEPGKAVEVDVSDGDAVSETLKFKNVTAVSKEGELPEASSDAGAPKLTEDEDYDNLRSIAGAGFALDLDVDETIGTVDLKGMYLQVDGSSKYYDISLDAPSNGRQAGFAQKRLSRSASAASRVQEYIDDIVISLPEGMAAGKFCITFAVYDDQNRVSNHINACVEVLKSGGENSSFLTENVWELVYERYNEYDNGEVYENIDSAGVTYSETWSVSLPCDSTWEEVSVDYERRYNMSLTLSANGTISIDESYYEKYVDDQNSTCENITFIVDEGEYNAGGSWTYDSDSKTLTLVIEWEFEDGESETQVVELQVEQDGDSLKLTEEEGEEFYELVFQPKN